MSHLLKDECGTLFQNKISTIKKKHIYFDRMIDMRVSSN